MYLVVADAVACRTVAGALALVPANGNAGRASAIASPAGPATRPFDHFTFNSITDLVARARGPPNATTKGRVR